MKGQSTFPLALVEQMILSGKATTFVILFLSKAQFRRRTFHEPNLIQIKVDPNHENPAF